MEVGEKMHLVSGIGLSRVNLLMAVRALEPSTITLLRNEGVPSFDVAAFAAVSDVDEGIINVIDVPNPTEDLAACIQAVHDAAAQHEVADVSLLSAGTNAFAMAVFLAFGGRPASIDRTEDIVLLPWEEDEEERFSTQPFSMEEALALHEIELVPGGVVVEGSREIPLPGASFAGICNRRIRLMWNDTEVPKRDLMQRRYEMMASVEALTARCGSKLFEHIYNGEDELTAAMLDAASRRGA